MLAYSENPLLTGNAYSVEDDYCRFNIQLYNNQTINLMMHDKDTLSELHQKINNRLRMMTPIVDIIPANTMSALPITIQPPINYIQIYDLFVCSQKTDTIVSIPPDKTMTISEFMKMYPTHFDDQMQNTLFVIDTDYYAKKQTKKPCSLVKYIMNMLSV